MSAGAQAVDKPLRILFGGSLTGGGEKLADVYFEDGTSESIRSGGLVHVYTGLEYRFTQKLSAQVNVGYHIHDTSAATNGSLKFSRVPVEVLGHYAVTPQWRLGGGLRFVDSVKFKGSGVLQGSVDFKPTTGAVLEAEYMVNPSNGVKLRAVSERYKTRLYGDTVSGSHVGLYYTLYL